jgi:hypothetical protein
MRVWSARRDESPTIGATVRRYRADGAPERWVQRGDYMMKAHLHELLAVLALLVLASAGHAGEYRTWNSRKGASVEARFDRVSGNFIVLQKTDGRFVKIEYSALSDTDQAHLRGGRNQEEREVATAREAATVRTPRHSQRAVQPNHQWNLDDDDERGVIVAEDPHDQNRWQQTKRNIDPAQLHEAAPLNDDDINGQNLWGWQQQQVRQQANLRQHNRRLQDQMQDPLQQDMWGQNSDDAHDHTAEWQRQQEQAERWQKQQEQQRVQMEKDMIKSRAFQLEGRIRDSRHSSHADYGGMSSEADILSQDASRLGESGAAWHFGNAASKLREVEREDNSLWNRQQDSFGSQRDSNRREAERDVWGGSGSINSFDSGSSMDSW